jgi:hypothetical protein
MRTSAWLVNTTIAPRPVPAPACLCTRRLCHKVSVYLPPHTQDWARTSTSTGRSVCAGPIPPPVHTYLVKGVLDGHHWVLGQELLVQIRELSTRQLLAAVVAGGLEVEVVLLSK